MLGSNQRPPPCRDGALPAELIALGASKCTDPLQLGDCRLATEMRWRVAASIAVFAIAGIPAANAAQAGGLRVSVKPASGSVHARFVISFSAAQATGRIGSTRRTYRVTANGPGHPGCESNTSAAAPESKAGSEVRVVLSPSRSGGWCPGTFHGAVWVLIAIVCPPGEACPAILPRPQMVGRFTFRVTRG
jgi:hypothetical protein